MICPEISADEISKMILESKQSVSWANFLALMKEIVISEKVFSKGYTTTEEMIIIPSFCCTFKDNYKSKQSFDFNQKLN